MDPDLVKPGLDLVGRPVILSFGLIGPGKGYELAIAAMPAVVAAIPNALYVILGVTHPELLLREGEAYRERPGGTCDRARRGAPRPVRQSLRHRPSWAAGFRRPTCS